MDRPTDGPSKWVVESRSTRLKTLQFGHQFHPNSSIQGRDKSKIEKNVRIDHQIHLVIKPSDPSIFEKLSNLNKKR